MWLKVGNTRYNLGQLGGFAIIEYESNFYICAMTPSQAVPEYPPGYFQWPDSSTNYPTLAAAQAALDGLLGNLNDTTGAS